MSCRWLALLLTLTGVGGTAAAQQERGEFEFWPGAELYVPLTSRWRALTTVGASTDYQSSFSELQVGAFADWAVRGTFRVAAPAGMRPRPPWVLRLGYRVSDRFTHLDAAQVEHRFMAEFTARGWLAGSLLLSLRGGVDYRILPTGDSWRLRPRVRADLPLRAGQVAIVPYGSIEPVWDSRWDAFVRTRFQLGAEIALAHGVVLNAFYAYQYGNQGLHRHVHGVGSILMLYL